MDKNMNISGIGKRMPYKAPDGVFDEIDRNVLSAAGCERMLSHRFRALSIAVAAAASLTLLVIVSWHQWPATTDSLAEVQQAFAKLDNADQSFLSEIYNEDTFININY